MKPIRRVITGQGANGKAKIVVDEQSKPIEVAPGVVFNPIWGADSAPSFPSSGEDPTIGPFFPTLGGYRFFIMSVPAGDGASASKEMMDAFPPLSVEDKRRLGSGLHDLAIEPDHPGMHTTDTVDLEIILDGEAALEFDDGQTVFLQQGDCFVQNGTRHRWFNRGSKPAIVAVIMIGGHPR